MLPRFELHRPTSITEVVEMRGRHGDEAALLCGGTELLLVMKLGLADYAHLIDIKRVPDIRGIHVDEDGLHIGAAASHREIERSAVVRDRWPQLARMEQGVANVRVRNVGTLGGNLCFADPHSDPATFLSACGATVSVAGAGGRRTLSVEGFTVGMFETALGDDEMLVSVTLPPLEAGTGVAHQKISLQERPTATVCARLRADAGEIVDARIVVGSVGVTPYRTAEAEQALVGGAVDDLEPTRVAAAAEAVATAAEPMEDDVASADYKRNLVRVLTERVVTAAAADASRT